MFIRSQEGTVWQITDNRVGIEIGTYLKNNNLGHVVPTDAMLKAASKVKHIRKSLNRISPVKMTGDQLTLLNTRTRKSEGDAVETLEQVDLTQFVHTDDGKKSKK